ncbi:MAG: RNA 2',3'-cyclic phosphodiesterase [Chloroflexi bacterium]|nr:RNA 2',3'-cyclic phosphodiesterase [Chloroflexota bacterium]
METIRSFIAIELPDKLKDELIRLQSALKTKGSFPVRWVSPQNTHLTLKFLGDVPMDKIDAITGAMAQAVEEVTRFRLEVRELGVFPNPRRPQIAWVGLAGELDKLNLLQKRIETGMKPLGFPPENRGFTAHLTLARVRDHATPEERQQFGQLIAASRFEATTSIDVDAINLMRSQLTPEGPVYTRIASVALKKHLSTSAT